MPRLSSLSQKSLTVLGSSKVVVEESATILDVDIGSRSYNSNSFQIGVNDDREPDQAITVIDGGTQMLGCQQPNILVYELGARYTANSSTTNAATISPSDANCPFGFAGFKTVHMSRDGVYLFAIEYDPPSNFALWRAELQSPFDITTADNWTESAGAATVEPFAIRLSPSGAYFYCVINGEIRMWDLDEFWDVSGIDLNTPDRTRNYNIADNLLDGAPGDLAWSKNGEEVFVKTGTYGQVRMYNCTTAWDPTDVTGAGTVDMSSGISAYQFGTGSGLWLEADQGKVWCTGQDVNNNICVVYEYTVPTAAPATPWYYPLTNSATDPTRSSWRSLQQGYSFVANDGIYTDRPITNMQAAFLNQTVTDTDLALWDVSTVDTFANCFQLGSTNLDLRAWDVSNARNMSNMFADNTSFNQPLDGWETKNVKTFEQMFYLATSFNRLQTMTGWNTSRCTNMTRMFDGTGITANVDLSGWAVDRVTEYLRFGVTAAPGASWAWINYPRFNFPIPKTWNTIGDWDTYTPTFGSTSDADGTITTNADGSITIEDLNGTSCYIFQNFDMGTFGPPNNQSFSDWFDGSTYVFTALVSGMANPASDLTTPRLRVRNPDSSTTYLDFPISSTVPLNQTVEYTGEFTISDTALQGDWELHLYIDTLGTNQSVTVDSWTIRQGTLPAYTTVWRDRYGVRPTVSFNAIDTVLNVAGSFETVPPAPFALETENNVLMYASAITANTGTRMDFTVNKDSSLTTLDDRVNLLKVYTTQQLGGLANDYSFVSQSGAGTTSHLFASEELGMEIRATVTPGNILIQTEARSTDGQRKRMGPQDAADIIPLLITYTYAITGGTNSQTLGVRAWDNADQFGRSFDVPADGSWVTISQNGYSDNLGTAITITNIGSAFDDDLWIAVGEYE